MYLVRHRCNVDLFIFRRYREKSHHLGLLNTHHLSHDFTHALDLNGLDLRCVFHRISVKLFGSNAHALDQLVCYQDGSSALIIRIQNKAVNNRHVLDVLMGNSFEHLLIGFRRNNFHRKLLFHLRVIRQGIDIEVRSLGDSVCHNINGLIYDFIVGSAVFHRIVELIDPNVHADVAALRCNGDCLVALIELVYRVD